MRIGNQKPLSHKGNTAYIRLKSRSDPIITGVSVTDKLELIKCRYVKKHLIKINEKFRYIPDWREAWQKTYCSTKPYVQGLTLFSYALLVRDPLLYTFSGLWGYRYLLFQQ